MENAYRCLKVGEGGIRFTQVEKYMEGVGTLVEYEYYSMIGHWIKQTQARLLLSVGRFCLHN